MIRSSPIKQWIPENKYRFLFISLLALILVAPVLEMGLPRWPIAPFFFLFCTTTALHAAGVKSRWQWFLTVIALGAILFWVLLLVRDPESVGGRIPAGMILLFTLYTMVAINGLLRQVFTEARVTADTVWGGIAIYVLLGIMFSLLYELAHAASSQAFTGPGLSVYPQNDMLYFSFTTLCTLGYGDIVPASGLTRALSTLEAIIGPVFLSVFVARLVSLHLADRT